MVHDGCRMRRDLKASQMGRIVPWRSGPPPSFMKLQETEDPRGTIIALEGEADLAAVPAFQKKMRAKAGDQTPALVLDFTGVTFVNTPIWAVVVEYYQAATHSGTQFAVAGLTGRVAASYEIVQLGEFIPTFERPEEALAQWQTSS